MAAIDLRATTLFIQDGTIGTITGTVGGSGIYPPNIPRNLATQTLPVSWTGGTPVVGSLIEIAGHLQYYEILDVSSTSMTIFPALVDEVDAGAAISVLGNGIYAKIGEGNLTYSEKQALVYIRDRGFIDTVKLGDQMPIDVSMDFTWEFLRGMPNPLASGGAPVITYVPTFEEAFKQIGNAVQWKSSSIDPCEPYCVEVIIMDIPTCLTDAERVQLSQFRWESFDHDLKGAKVAVKGTCNIGLATVTHQVT